MEMLCSTDKKKMEELLGGSEIPETVMTVPMVCGFIHGVVITPLVQTPTKWLPLLYGGELPAADEEQILERFTFFSRVYENYLKKFHDDQLVFPFSYEKLEPDQLDDLQEWIVGLHAALSEHPHLWLQEEDPFIHNEAADDIGLCLFYLHSLARPDEVKETLSDEGSFDPADDETIISMLSAVPSIVAMLTSYGKELAAQMVTGQAAAPASPFLPIGKTGRNAACPCGSGKKYKKCCGRRDS